MSDLLKHFDDGDTDKGSRKHFYNEVYEPHFEPLRNEEINILEIGIFRGESLRAFHSYFPKANLYGIDIFTRVNPDDLGVLKRDRVHWLKGDSLSPTIVDLVNEKWPGVKFDIIIDDGAHWPEANRLTFKHMFQFLKDDGKYFVEDVWPFHVMKSKDLAHQWILREPDKYNKLAFQSFLNEIEEYKTTFYDVRQKKDFCRVTGTIEYIPDSTIYMIQK